MVFSFLKKNKRLVGRELEPDSTATGQYKRRRSPVGREEVEVPEAPSQEPAQQAEDGVLKFTEWDADSAVITLQIGATTPGSSLTSDTLKRLRRQSSQQALNKSIKTRDFYQSSQSIVSVGRKKGGADERRGGGGGAGGVSCSRSIPSLLLPTLYTNTLSECVEGDSGDIYETVNQSPRSLVFEQKERPPRRLDFFGSRSDLFNAQQDIYGSKNDLYAHKNELYGSKSEFLFQRRELYSPKGTLLRGREGREVGEESGNFYESDSGVSSLYEPLSFHNNSLEHPYSSLNMQGSSNQINYQVLHSKSSSLQSAGSSCSSTAPESKTSSLDSTGSRLNLYMETEELRTSDSKPRDEIPDVEALKTGIIPLGLERVEAPVSYKGLSRFHSTAGFTGTSRRSEQSVPLFFRNSTLSPCDRSANETGYKQSDINSSKPVEGGYTVEDIDSCLEGEVVYRSRSSVSKNSRQTEKRLSLQAETLSTSRRRLSLVAEHQKTSQERNTRNGNPFHRDLTLNKENGGSIKSNHENALIGNGYMKRGHSNGHHENVRKKNVNNENECKENGHMENGYRENRYAENGYKENGYAENGYKENGYAENGYIENGYSHNGFKENGYAENGYKENGYAKNGYKENGYAENACKENHFEENGYEKHGYKKNGYEEHGYKENDYEETSNEQGLYIPEIKTPLREGRTLQSLVHGLLGQIDVPLPLYLLLCSNPNPGDNLAYIQDVLPEISVNSSALSLISERERTDSILDSGPDTDQLAGYICKELQERIDLLRCRLSILESEWGENNATLAIIQSTLCPHLQHSQMNQLSCYSKELEISTRLLYSLSSSLTSCASNIISLTLIQDKPTSQLAQLALDREFDRHQLRKDGFIEKLDEAKFLKQLINKRRSRIEQLISRHLAPLYIEKFADFSTKLVDIVYGEMAVKEKMRCLERQRNALKILFKNVSISVL